MTTKNAFIGRQPVLNRNQQLIGYELLFRPTAQADAAGPTAVLAADTQVLVNTLNHMGTSWLVGNKLAFINVGEEMLTSDFLELLPPRRIILEIAPDIALSAELQSRVRHLRSMGFNIALDKFHFDAPSAAFLEQASYVKLDTQDTEQKAFELSAARLRSFPVSRIAERVETREQFHLCQNLGFDGYQGFYFARPETLSAKVINATFANTLTLLNLLRQDADIHTLEDVLKRDVALSYKLLRYVNSAAAGLNTTISSFAHAVTVLGYKKLYRWLTLLLITAGDGDSVPPALQKTVVTRGRLMELLGQSKNFSPENCDNLFITGMFSLLDVLFDMPMDQVIEHMHLPEAIQSALLGKESMYTPYLQLAQACERLSLDGVPERCAELGLDSEAFNQAHTSALAWVEGLGL
ncbi:EAL domain-containing protein [Paludibacterium sp.]|uniref:EAL and HDOD domain-containing protein n=1 Tax=Paludibacterium sp. TaxID=1917523 RepID=UPI0025D1B5A0|nr:EAL domain-containing protein [Paludibacterium sp.]MBV8648383.1 EAL domain-containing protein [Paludibacterium sp.]